MDRTGIAKSEGAGGEVVAEIGAEKITKADLENAREAALIHGIDIYGAGSLLDVVGHVNTKQRRLTQTPQGLTLKKGARLL